MNVCDVCVEMMNIDCKHCRYGNPCIGCADYDQVNDVCTSNGACGDLDKNIEGEKDEKR